MEHLRRLECRKFMNRNLRTSNLHPRRTASSDRLRDPIKKNGPAVQGPFFQDFMMTEGLGDEVPLLF
jgi:hypothetical protein